MTKIRHGKHKTHDLAFIGGIGVSSFWSHCTGNPLWWPVGAQCERL